jgi:hypothetical protein
MADDAWLSFLQDLTARGLQGCFDLLGPTRAGRKTLGVRHSVRWTYPFVVVRAPVYGLGALYEGRLLGERVPGASIGVAVDAFLDDSNDEMLA